MERIKKKCKRSHRKALLRFLDKSHCLSMPIEVVGIDLGHEPIILDEEVNNES